MVLRHFSLLISSGLTAFIPGDEGSLFHQLNPIMTFILLGFISLLLLRIAHKKRPTAKDLGFHQPVFTKRNILIIAAVFVITHLFFYLAGKWGGVSSDATALFIDSGFGQSFTLDLIVIIASTILAPVVEATIYRGVMLRWIHDALMRRFKGSSSIFSVPALAAVVVTALFFIMPHVSEMSLSWTTAALPVQALASSTCSPAFLVTGIQYRNNSTLIIQMTAHNLLKNLSKRVYA